MEIQMISFKQFVNEAVVKAWKSEDAELADAITMLNSRCKDGLAAIANGSLLFRGDYEAENIRFIDSTDSVRTSKDSNSIYQLMFDASDKMKGIPSRTNSVICSTKPDTAFVYGAISIVVPFDGAEVACSTKVHDLFFTSVKSRLLRTDVALESLSNDFAYILKELKYGNIDKKFTDINELDSFLSKVSPAKIVEAADEQETHFDSVQLMKFLSNCPHDKKFTSLSSELISPESVGVSTFKYGDVIPFPAAKTPVGIECWVSGKCAIIPLPIFKSIIRTMHDLKMPIHSSVKKLFL